MKILKDKDKIIVNGIRATVGTSEGFAEENLLEDIVWTPPCTVGETMIISSSKEYQIQREEKWKNAIKIREGETVMIEGKKYKVKCRKDTNVSDPIEFVQEVKPVVDKTVRVVAETFYNVDEKANLVGLTVKQVMKKIRHEMNLGNIGSLKLDLSDGTFLSVELQEASDGCYLMNSQYFVRWRYATPSERGNVIIIRKRDI